MLAGAASALIVAYVLNIYLLYLLLPANHTFSYSLTFFPPALEFHSAKIEFSISLVLLLISDLLLIAVELPVLTFLAKRIAPPFKFGVISLLLTLIGILLVKFVYKGVLLVFVKASGLLTISTLSLFYSRKELLLFLFFAFLLTFGFITYYLNKIKSLLDSQHEDVTDATVKK